MLNGGLVTGPTSPAFIVTLGTLEHRVRPNAHRLERHDLLGLPERAALLRPHVLDRRRRFTYGVVLMLVLYAIAWFALSQTAWGRHVYAVGDNPEAARLTGINDETCSVQRLHARRPHLRDRGDAAGRAALSSATRTPARRRRTSTAITAVVLGGTSLFGGRGTVIGTLIGAMIVGVFRNGLTLIGVRSSTSTSSRASSSSSPSRWTS